MNNFLGNKFAISLKNSPQEWWDVANIDFQNKRVGCFQQGLEKQRIKRIAFKDVLDLKVSWPADSKRLGSEQENNSLAAVTGEIAKRLVKKQPIQLVHSENIDIPFTGIVDNSDSRKIEVHSSLGEGQKGLPYKLTRGAGDACGLKCNQIEYVGKTGLGRSKEWESKLLGEWVCNIGFACRAACVYCYTIISWAKIVSRLKIIEKDLTWENTTAYRSRINLLTTLNDDLFDGEGNLRRKWVGRRDTAQFCSTVDPCLSSEDAETTIQCIRLLMKHTELNVRVLSKSVLIRKVADALREFKDRIFYGLSIGTTSDDLGRAIERRTSLPSARIRVHQELQDAGFRVYGMVCPVLPGELNRFDDLISAIRVDRCEHVWVEPVNLRGKNFANTLAALENAQLKDEAIALEKVSTTRTVWRQYSKELFQKASFSIPPGKLRFMQYVEIEPEDFKLWFADRVPQGALLL